MVKPTHISQECAAHFSRANLEARLRWMAGHYARAHTLGMGARKKRKSADKAKTKQGTARATVTAGKKSSHFNSTESRHHM